MKHNLKTIVLSANDKAILEAARIIQAGGLVAMPTETVYGLAADATNGLAAARIFEAKGRPRFNPLIVHVPDITSARTLGKFTEAAEKLAAAFWPGPMTLVLRRQPDSQISDLVTAGLDTVAIRIPGHPVAQSLLSECSRPLAAPSANRSGHISPTIAQHVASDLSGHIDMILDGGACEVGIESTVIDASSQTVAMLRPGGVPAAAAAEVLGKSNLHGISDDGSEPSAPSSPGQLSSHYAPNSHLRLNVTKPQQDEAVLAFGEEPPNHNGPMINLSPTANLREAAANLFAALRTLDASGCKSIAVVPIPGEGLGEAINDRLLRAAAPRP